MKKKILFFCFALFFLFLFFSTREVFAQVGIPDGDAYPVPCGSCNGYPGKCAKSEPGNCPSCGTFSSDCCGWAEAWTKWDASCRVVNTETGACYWIWIYDTRVCSTADKCIAGEEGLRPGNCDCGYGSSLYKACCSGSTPVSCISAGTQDGSYPDEGACPGTTVFCGFGDNPSCDQACATGGASPSPGATPPPLLPLLIVADVTGGKTGIIVRGALVKLSVIIARVVIKAGAMILIVLNLKVLLPKVDAAVAMAVLLPVSSREQR